MLGLYDLLAILFLGWVFYLLGFRIVRTSRTAEPPDETDAPEHQTSEPAGLVRRQVLLDALNHSPYTEVLSPRQRDRLRYSLLNPGDTWVEPPPVEEFETPAHVNTVPASPTDTTFVPPARVKAAALAPSAKTDAALEGVAQSTVSVPQREKSAPTSAPKPPRTPVLGSIRSAWDPAVMMLYLGALLVVVAGLIFATYNWGTLGGWQKLGLLIAATGAFLIAGFAIRTIERVKPASTIFIVIGGLLVPANFLAAYTVFDDVQPAMPLLFGAVATTVVHALLSYQPGASFFRYSAVGAALIAIVTVPAATGLSAGWGGVLGLVVIAVLPDHLLRLSRFRKAWITVSQLASGPLAGFAIWQGWENNGWVIAGALVGVSMVATRLSLRYPELRPYLLAFADLMLIAASVQIAHNFDGDRWMIGAGLFALTLVLLHESRRFPVSSCWFEFAAALSTSALAGEVVRVPGTETWSLAAGLATLAILMMVHARRYQSLAPTSEAIAAIALPGSPGAALYALDPSLWSLILTLATLAGTSVWLGLRRTYPQNWPGFVATASAIGSIIVLAPAIGSDVGWGCTAALLIVAIAPYPFGRWASFRQPWLRFANVLAVPIAFVALWRGSESNTWLVPIVLIAVSIWLNRLALEEIFDRVFAIVVSDFFAILGVVGVAWVLRDEQWVIATALLALTLVLLKRSRTWPDSGSLLEIIACVTFAGAVASVIAELTNADWALFSFAATLTSTVLLHANRRSNWSSISEGIAALTLPASVGLGILAYNNSEWWFPISMGVLTLTLVLYGVRHRELEDGPFALASFSFMVTAVAFGRVLGWLDHDSHTAELALGTGVMLISAANLLPKKSVSDWLRNLLRAEATALFFVSTALTDFDVAWIGIVILAAYFWTLWVTANAFWSLLVGGTIAALFLSIVVPSSAGSAEGMWWYLALAAIFTALAWQLDGRTRPMKELTFRAGIYVWLLMALTTLAQALIVFWDALNGRLEMSHGLALLGTAFLYWVGVRSNRVRGFWVGVAFYAALANVVLVPAADRLLEHGIIAAILTAAAISMYWYAQEIQQWVGLLLVGFATIHLGLATNLTVTQDLTACLMIAWLLVSLCVLRWRNGETRLANHLILQVIVLHVWAVLLPTYTSDVELIPQGSFVIILVSLAGAVATYGSLRRSRELVLIASGIGMSALMLQIGIGEPANLHMYTVPLSIYLLAVGLILRRDPRFANIMLAAGSGMLVVPAMIEALTTGEISWLWVALAEAIGLFLFGTVLRLRIPTAGGVIAVSVIVLRMLVFVVNALESWVSILAVGVALLFIGTMWLIFREAIQGRARAVFGRWQRFD